MTSIILVHTFAPHPDEHYTALPGEEGQPVSYVRRIVVEGSAVKAYDLSLGFLKEGEAVANTYEVPGSAQAATKDEIFMSRRAAENLKKAEPKPAPAKPQKP